MKPPSVAVLGVGVEGDRAIGGEIAHADLVELERSRCGCSSVLTFTLYLARGTVARDGAGAELEEVGAPGQHRLLRSSRPAWPRTGRRPAAGASARGDDVAPAHVDLVGEGQTVTDWPATACVEVAVGGDDAGRRWTRGPRGATRTRSPGRTRARRRCCRRSRGSRGSAGSPTAPAGATAADRAGRRRSRPFPGARERGPPVPGRAAGSSR